MTVSMTKPTLDTTLEGLIRVYYSPNLGSGLPASKQSVAQDYWERGLREGIAAILFQLRGDSLPRFKTIPLIYQSDVLAILAKSEKDFVHGGPGDKITALDVIIAQLKELAVPADLIETDESERRRLVIEGKEPALASDGEWLTPLVEAKRRELEELAGLLQPMDRKVNDAPRATLKPECPECHDHVVTRHFVAHLTSMHGYTEDKAEGALMRSRERVLAQGPGHLDSSVVIPAEGD